VEHDLNGRRLPYLVIVTTMAVAKGAELLIGAERHALTNSMARWQ